MPKTPKILFLSTGNSTRGQIAEGFLKCRVGECQTASAGIASHEAHPLAVEVMNEVGIDISGQKSKTVAESLRDSYSCAVIIYDAARERSPIFPFTLRQLRWSLSDPEITEGSAAERKQAFRRTRDEIRAHVENLLRESGAQRERDFPAAA